MEISVAQYLATIDASLIIIDCNPNMNASLISARAVPLVPEAAPVREYIPPPWHSKYCNTSFAIRGSSPGFAAWPRRCMSAGGSWGEGVREDRLLPPTAASCLPACARGRPRACGGPMTCALAVAKSRELCSVQRCDA